MKIKTIQTITCAWICFSGCHHVLSFHPTILPTTSPIRGMGTSIEIQQSITMHSSLQYLRYEKRKNQSTFLLHKRRHDGHNHLKISSMPTSSGNIPDKDVSVKENYDSISSFKKDSLYVLNELASGADESLSPASFDNSDLTLTKVWTLPMWEKHTNRKRYIRHLWKLLSGRSRLVQRILPQFSIYMLWSIFCLSFLSTKVVTATASVMVVPMTQLSILSTYVAFLLTLRTNQGLARLKEGRELWGRAFIAMRDTAQIFATYAYDKDNQTGLKSARFLCLFAWLLRGRLRDTQDDEFLNAMLPSKLDHQYVTSHRKKPAAVLARIRQIAADLSSRDIIPLASHIQLEKNLNELNYILGMCERLKGSPIPPVYTSHLCRLVCMYLFFFPLALHTPDMKRFTYLIITSIVGWIVLGLDEISHLLENPFRLMPLKEISRNIMMDVVDAFCV